MLSEVLTNAIRHTRSGAAGGTVTLNFLDLGSATRVEVIDAGGAVARPEPREEVPRTARTAMVSGWSRPTPIVHSACPWSSKSLPTRTCSGSLRVPQVLHRRVLIFGTFSLTGQVSRKILMRHGNR